MGRFHFREDDDYNDDDDTDYDSSPSKEPQQQQHRGGRFQFRRSHYGEHEDGEIIEDESCSGNERTASDAYESNHSYQEDRWKSSQDDASHVDAQRNPQPSFRSYLPWTSRRRYSNENSPWSEEEEEDVNGDGDGPKEGNKEYRLIASTKYDRNYDRSDFYPTGIDSNHSYESSNNYSNTCTNAVSDDEDDNNNSNNYHDERDTPYGRGSNPSHQQLSRYNSSNGSAVAPEIHYHIYVSDQQASRWFGPNHDGTPRLLQGEGTHPPRRRTSLWKRISLWAAMTQLLVFLVGRYDLVTVSPPPSYLTWEDYRSHQFRLVRKLSREGYVLLHHLSKAATQGIMGQYEENETQAARYAFPESWKSFVPPQPPNNNFNTGEEHRGSGRTWIFGQEKALEHLQNGLNRWSSSQQLHLQWNPSWRQTQQQQQQQPLVVYVYGGRGVGKGSLAYLLLDQLQRLDASDADSTPFASVLEECAAAAAAKDSSLEADSDRDHFYCPLLHLTPNDYLSRVRTRDYRNDNDDSYHAASANSYDGATMGATEGGGHLDGDSSSSFVYQTILDHVVAAGGGASIVVLDDVDDSTTRGCEHGAEFCEENLPASWWKDVLTEIQSQPAIFGNTIVVLTSQIGTTTVEKWTRKRLQSLAGEKEALAKAVTAAGNAEIEALLRYEVLRYRHGMNMDDWLLIPMAPLERTPMAWILQRIAASGPNPPFLDKRTASHLPNLGEEGRAAPREPIVLTDSASDRILDALEWHQWIHKSSGEVLRIWSPLGALPLVQLWEERLWKSRIDLSNCPTNKNENDILLLDFEGSSTDRLWLRSCRLAREGDAGVVKSMDGRRWKCRGETFSSGSCMFYL